MSSAATWNGLGRRLAAGIEQVEAEFAQVARSTSRLRLLPAGTIFRYSSEPFVTRHNRSGKGSAVRVLGR